MLRKSLSLSLIKQKSAGTFLSLSGSPFSSLSEWLRKAMNRIRYQQNRAIQQSQNNLTIQILQTPQQVQTKFVGDEQFKSLVEKQRMKKIDQILGTKTYFHQTKFHQERLDSDHVMAIQALQKKSKQQKRSNLNWENPQLQMQMKVKSSRKYFRAIKKLRDYPVHHQTIKNFSDQKGEQNIEFLGKQGLYSKLSLKWVQTYQKSVQFQSPPSNVLFQMQSRRFSSSICYFSTQNFSTSLFSIKSNLYTSQLLTSTTKFKELFKQIREIINLDQIYNVLKEYYHDQRVKEWLRRVQNGNIQYLISGYTTNLNDDKIVFWIDLLGNKKEYVFLVKDLNIKQTQSNINSTVQQSLTSSSPSQIMSKSLSPNVLFNCKPSALFSPLSNQIYLIQRSEQGAFTQLIKVKLKQDNNFGSSQIIFKCKTYEELSIFKDQNQQYLFLRINMKGQQYHEKVFIVHEKHNQNQQYYQFINVQNGKKYNTPDQKQSSTQQTQPKAQENTQQVKSKISKTTQNTQKQRNKNKQLPYRLFVDWCNKGLIIMKYQPSLQQSLKYGSCQQYSKSIELIPYKAHIQLINDSMDKIDPILNLPSSKSINSRVEPSQLQFECRQVLFSTQSPQFISTISVRQTHIVILISTQSVYSRKRLHFLPFSQAKNPHSLIFQTHQLNLLSFGNDFNKQVLYFQMIRTKALHISQVFMYTIWKRQLEEIKQDKITKGIYIEKLKINPNVDIILTCLQRYLQLLPKFQINTDVNEQHRQQFKQSQQYILQRTRVPILLYLSDSDSSRMVNENIKKFLQKGTMIISINCRGMLQNNLIKFHQGSGLHIANMIEDIRQVVEYVGEHLGTNLSFYGKGPVSGLLGMLINVKHPFLFTSTVLHNGVYDLRDRQRRIMDYNKYFFAQDQTYDLQNQKVLKTFWKQYSPIGFGFKKSKVPKLNQQIQEDELNVDAGEPLSQQLIKKVLKQSQPNAVPSQSCLPQKVPQIGTLQNILISTSLDKYPAQSREMIYHLRKNKQVKYDQVYLKEFDFKDDQELFNLSFIWGNMKQRLQDQSK